MKRLCPRFVALLLLPSIRPFGFVGGGGGGQIEPSRATLVRKCLPFVSVSVYRLPKPQNRLHASKNTNTRGLIRCNPEESGRKGHGHHTRPLPLSSLLRSPTGIKPVNYILAPDALNNANFISPLTHCLLHMNCMDNRESSPLLRPRRKVRSCPTTCATGARQQAEQNKTTYQQVEP